MNPLSLVWVIMGILILRALKRRGFINHGSTLQSRACFKTSRRDNGLGLRVCLYYLAAVTELRLGCYNKDSI